MKKISIILLLLVTTIHLSAQQAGDVTLKEVRIEKVGNLVEVSFKARIGKRATKSNYKLVLTPVLYQGNQTENLTPIVVETRATKIMDIRERISAGKKAPKAKPEYYATANRLTVDYSVRVPYQEWMNGGNLRMDRLSCGCCDEASLAPLAMANALALLPPAPPPALVVEVEEPVKPVRQLRQWNFSKKDMMIDFSVSRTHIDLALFENQSTLNEVIAAVNKIASTSGATIDKIEITGYASPEGSVSNNQRLADKRANALKEYIQKEISSLPDSTFNLKNGQENWKGLREIVAASDMPYKQQVLHIIDTVPVEIIDDNSRKKELMNLKGGKPYLYMMKHFFPKLRNACYIGVYYLNAEDAQQ